MKTRGLYSVNQRLGNIVPFIKNIVKERKKIVVLEIGCGYGNAMKQLKQKIPQIKIIGMNFRKYKKQIKNQKYIYGDAGKKIPLKSNSVDFIYLIATLQFVKNKAKFFEEAFRVLKPEGQLRINVSNSLGKEFKEYENPCVIETKKGKTNLRDYLLKIKNYDIKLKKAKKKKVIIITKHKKDKPLKLKLKLINSKCVDYGKIFNKQHGFIRSWYKKL